MNNIPIQLIQMIKGGNPQNILLNMIQQNSNNPMFQNINTMINNNDNKGIEQMARNLCASKGINADEMLNNVKQQFYSR